MPYSSSFVPLYIAVSLSSSLISSPTHCIDTYILLHLLHLSSSLFDSLISRSEEASHSMSSRSRPSRSRHSSSSATISEDQVLHLLSKLQHLIPEARYSRRSGNRVSASKVLQETCNYIKSLHQEVDDLSERLAELLANMDVDNAQAAMIRNLFM